MNRYCLKMVNKSNQFYETLEDAWEGFRIFSESQYVCDGWIEYREYDYSFNKCKEMIENTGIRYFGDSASIVDNEF